MKIKKNTPPGPPPRQGELSIISYWSDEDDCYIAENSVFPMVKTHGDTKIKAITEMEKALNGCISTIIEDSKKN